MPRAWVGAGGTPAGRRRRGAGIAAALAVSFSVVSGGPASAGDGGEDVGGALPAVLVVRSARADGSVSHGSGVLVAPDLVLTARHVLVCGVLDTVALPGAEPVPAEPIASLPGHDLAVLRLRGQLPRDPAPRDGDPWGPLRVLGARSGAVEAGLRWADGQSVGLEVAVAPGDSGAPVLDGAGRLVGVVVHAGTGGLGEPLAVAAGPEAIDAVLRGGRGACGPADRALAAALRRARAGERSLIPVGGPGVRATRARLAAERDARGGRAARAAERLRSRGPDDVRTRLLVGRLALLAGDVDAVEAVVHAEAGNPEAAALLVALVELDPARVERSATALLATADHPLAWLARCRARASLGRPVEALHDCRVAAAAPRAPLPALVEAATLAQRAGEPGEACALATAAAARAGTRALRALAEASCGEPLSSP